jgi:hypothetical protein
VCLANDQETWETLGQQTREFLVRGRSHLDVMARLRIAMKQNNFGETVQSTETSATFYAASLTSVFSFRTKTVTFTATPVGEDTRLLMLVDVTPGSPDNLVAQATKIAGEEVTLEVWDELSSQQRASQSDIPDQIRKLAELRDMGAISNEEFEAKKRELLDRM